ncbi:MAG TPA: hypothetical protein VLZ53_03130 [Devosia sp.]|nr:hypothetical protein [Devosia sp.]
MKRLLALILLCLFVTPALAHQQAMLDKAVAAAAASFARALPQLEPSEFGVETSAYGDALGLGMFHSPHWGKSLVPHLVIRQAASGSCDRYAAFVRMPPEDGAISLVLCPQFFTPGAERLRELTILHEMVHVVAGPDECRAMAYAARIELLAHQQHTPVDAYWHSSNCQNGAFRLP